MTKASRQPPTIDAFEALDIYSFPFKGQNVGVLILFTLMYSWVEFSYRFLGVSGLAISALPLYLSTLFFVGYLLIILEYTAMGYQRVPAISGSLLYEARGPLVKTMILVSFLLAIVYLVQAPWWQLFFGICSLILLPISIGILAIENSIVAALSPLRWYMLLLRMESRARFAQCLGLEAVLLIAVYFVAATNLGVLNVARVLVVLSLLMMVFRCYGVLLHDNAVQLGISVTYSKDVENAQRAAADRVVIADFMYEIHQLVSGGNSSRAWEVLDARLKKENFSNEAAYFEHAQRWDNPTIALRLGQGYIGRLIKADDMQGAWRVLEYCYATNDEEYRLASGASIFALEPFANSRRRNEILFHLFSYFEKDFPAHPRIADASIAAERIAGILKGFGD